MQILDLDRNYPDLKLILSITGTSKDEPYYVRAKFFLNIEETDMYGFHMISDHSGKLYVSTDHDPANVVSNVLTKYLFEMIIVGIIRLKPG